MENEFAKPLGSEITNSGVSHGLRTAGLMLAGSALVAICSHIALPLGLHAGSADAAALCGVAAGTAAGAAAGGSDAGHISA